MINIKFDVMPFPVEPATTTRSLPALPALTCVRGRTGLKQFALNVMLVKPFVVAELLVGW